MIKIWIRVRVRVGVTFNVRVYCRSNCRRSKMSDILIIRYIRGRAAQMGLFSREKSLHMGPYFSQKKIKNPYRWVTFWGLGVRTYFASIPREKS